MPPKKKQAISDPPVNTGEDDDPSDHSSTDEEDSNSDSSSSVDSQLVVQVEFDAREIEDADYHGIRRLLQQVFLKASVDLSALTDLIIAQSNHIGSTIKVCDDEEEVCGDNEAGRSSTEEHEGEDVLGVISLVNLTQHKKKGFVKQLKELLLLQCKTHDGSKLAQFSALLSDDSKPVGFLVNERFINIPPDIAPPLLRSLLTQIEDLSQRYPDQHTCEYYVLLARSHQTVCPPKPQTGKKRKKKLAAASAETSSSTLTEQSITFDYYEDEIFHKMSQLSFSYPVSEESDELFDGQWCFEDSTLKPYRTVMVVSAARFEEIVIELERTFKE